MGALGSSSATPDLFTPRRRERRNALGDLLVAVTRTLRHREDLANVRGAFEAAMLRLTPIRTAALRDVSSRWSGRPDAAKGPESIVLEVPGSEPYGPGTLEATFDPSAALGEWDFQMIGFAAHVAALVLEIERCRQQLARANLLLPVQPRADGAAPLIGSTAVMRELRETIARVAVTDFTVLLEGESGVGKELVARQIHELSRRRTGPFVAINCAALVETLLEAELFGIEDRIRYRRSSAPRQIRSGGRRHAVSRRSVRPVANGTGQAAKSDSRPRCGTRRQAPAYNGSTFASLRRRIAACARWSSSVRFEPICFTASVGVDVRVPALRERREDILELTRYFLAEAPVDTNAAAFARGGRCAGHTRLARERPRAGTAYRANDRARCQRCDRIGGSLAGDQRPTSHGARTFTRDDDTLRTWARKYVRLMLARHGGNKRHTARTLGISYHTLKAYLRTPFSESTGGGNRRRRMQGRSDWRDERPYSRVSPASA
jgi:hypothetical protein